MAATKSVTLTPPHALTHARGLIVRNFVVDRQAAFHMNGTLGMVAKCPKPVMSALKLLTVKVKTAGSCITEEVGASGMPCLRVPLHTALCYAAIPLRGTT